MSLKTNNTAKTVGKKVCDLHTFSKEDILLLRQHLLGWYTGNKRDLPWRRLTVNVTDRNQRGYIVWVSEVMLQQTQVATVIDYYNKWMRKWPTMRDLAKASLEEINEIWSGLGYYSRAKRLYEAVKKVVNELNGEMPSTANDLVKQLPGVGRYTAGAIASIAFGQCTGVVDGNVIRVLSRLRIIGAESTSSFAVETFWTLISQLVDDTQPGDFNQAIMELGATLCTPKSPECLKCPLKTLCLAYKHTKTTSNAKFLGGSVKKDDMVDMEDLCQLCFPKDGSWNTQHGVCNYPRKQKLKEAKQERVGVCILLAQCGNSDIAMETSGEDCMVICKRPKTGLLAGLWEFPNTVVKEGCEVNELIKFVEGDFNITLSKGQFSFVGEVKHIFSHVHHTYVIYKVTVTKQLLLQSERDTKWVTFAQFSSSAISTAMRKVFNTFQNGKGIKRKNEANDEKKNRKQRVLDSYFTRK